MLIFPMESFFHFLSTMILGVGYIQTGNLFPEPLNPEQEKIYIEQMINGDSKSKEILIEHNLRLVAHIAKKYNNTNIDQEDLISIGTIGLIKGINSFNTEKNIKLATYTARCIENEILMFLRSNKKTNSEVFLNEPIGKDKDDNVITLQEMIVSDEKNVEDEVDLKINVGKLYKKIKTVLRDRERLIIELRFGLLGDKPKTQKEIAEMLNISRSYVSRIETKAIRKLAKEIDIDE